MKKIPVEVIKLSHASTELGHIINRMAETDPNNEVEIERLEMLLKIGVERVDEINLEIKNEYLKPNNNKGE